MEYSGKDYIERFKYFLINHADYVLQEVEILLRSIKPGDEVKLKEMQLLASRRLSDIYTKFLDFLTSLEEQTRKIGLPVMAELVQRIGKEANSIDQLKRSIISIERHEIYPSSQGGILEDLKDNLIDEVDRMRQRFHEEIEELTLAERVLKSDSILPLKTMGYLSGDLEDSVNLIINLIEKSVLEFKAEAPRIKILLESCLKQVEENRSSLKKNNNTSAISRVLVQLELIENTLKDVLKRSKHLNLPELNTAKLAYFRDDCNKELQSIRKVSKLAIKDLRSQWESSSV